MKFFKIQKNRPEIQKLFDYIENNQEKIRFDKGLGLITIRLPENDILNIYLAGDMHISRCNNSPLSIILTDGEMKYFRKLYNSLIKIMKDKEKKSALEYISNLFSKTRYQVEKANKNEK